MKIKLPTFSRRIYVAYLIFAIAAVVAVVGFVVLIQRQQDIAFKAQVYTMERTSEALATHIAAIVRAALGAAPDRQAVAAVQELIDSYQVLGDVFNVRVSRADNSVVAAIRRKNLEKPEGLQIMLAAFQGKRGASYETVDGVRNFCVAVPIQLGGQNWGAVVLYRNLEPTYVTVRTANRRIVWVTSLTFVALITSIGGLLWLATIEVRRAREAEAKHSRLALMGTMATSVAHEIRNPLNSLNLSIEYMKRRARGAEAKQDGSADLADDLASMQHEVHRLEQVVRDFSDLSREPRVEPQRVSLRGAIEHVLKLFQPMAQQQGIRLESQLRDGDALVDVDLKRMEQVLINLVKNAIEATPAKGTVSIRTSKDNARLLLDVSDTGKGIAPDEQALIFEPFHSTRSHGLGLGLFLSKRLVEAHRGALTMTSQPGAGTTFRISLPAAAG
jgi:signal transduction histidine kinase